MPVEVAVVVVVVVLPSPKFQSRVKGETPFDIVAVKVTVVPISGVAGEWARLTARTPPTGTLTVLDVAETALASVTLTEAMNVPVVLYVCPTVLVVVTVVVLPSPKFHAKLNDGTPPVTVAVKVTTEFTAGLDGENAKDTDGLAATTTLSLFEVADTALASVTLTDATKVAAVA